MTETPIEEPIIADHAISIVIPVYQGEKTLGALMTELEPFFTPHVSADGHSFVVSEVLLVHDNGPDESAPVIRALGERYDVVRPIWLSRNFGQHPATIAGMASSGGDWIVTIDEDGQHDPAFISSLLDTAMRDKADVVYAKPSNAAPHGFVRNAASKGAKAILNNLTSGGRADLYQSYRLVLGAVGRSVAAYAGSGVYLDIALGWIARKVVTSPVRLRDEGSDRQSGYSYKRLMSHFWRMVLSSGTRGLRIVSVIGVAFVLLAILIALVILVGRLTDNGVPEGWASTIVAILLSSGAMLFSLGIIAEYLGVAVGMAQGRPPYVIVRDYADGPLGRPARFAK